MRTRVALVLGGAVAASLTLGGGVALADEGVRPGITHAVVAPAGKAVAGVAARPASAKPSVGARYRVAVISASPATGTPKPGAAKAVSARRVTVKAGSARLVTVKAGTGKATACVVEVAPAK